MNRILTGALFLSTCALIGLTAFQTPTPPQVPPKPAPTPAPTPAPVPAPVPAPAPEDPDARRPKDSPVRISSLPDGDKEKLAKQYETLTQWLAKDLGRPVEFVPVSDVAEAVVALKTNKLDVVWLGGADAVLAELACKGKCWPVLAREEDLKFKSYFIANKKHVDAGTFQSVAERNPMPLEQLAALKPKFASLTFSFGAKTSASGHFMPRYFLEMPEVGIDPEKGFKAKPAFEETGAKSTVLANVASGAVDLGVVSSLAWEKAKDEEKLKAPVIFVTPEYTDYCMVSHGRTGPALPLRVQGAFIRLDPKIEEQKAVLDMFGTKRFVAISQRNLAGVRETLKSAKERGLLE